MYEVLYQRCGTAAVNDVGYLHRCVVFLYVKLFAENTSVKIRVLSIHFKT